MNDCNAEITEARMHEFWESYVLKIEVNYRRVSKILQTLHLKMGESIQEWYKWSLWETVFKKFYLVHSWILWPKWNYYLLDAKLLETGLSDFHKLGASIMKLLQKRPPYIQTLNLQMSISNFT